MRNLSTTAKIVMVAGALFGVFVFLVVVDLGVNAGLIHYGVKVGHIDVGGMTPVEAERVIGEVGEEMQSTAIVFGAEGLGPYTWTPEELGWEPRKLDLARKAMKVGRRSDVFHSFGDRAKSWIQGIKIRWERPNRGKVRSEVREVAEEADLLGLVVDKSHMQFLIKKATWDWPREPVYEIPFKS